ncbi:hypothetical protein [Streptomyces echinatus]|uniref:Uncharacterized protein n=1 Tax=Streptomyces echinatus TaxID=67293 RepID=A0A7W9Q2V3_9ACTN|nr:hypothetical protein [Streptomyces echinatus]MBB5932098.1 hypothetical protein [Streptomyces echinatus]
MTTATAAPDPVPARAGEAGTAASGYLNLQQCVYYAASLTDHFTTVLTPSGDGRYSTGTKLSGTPDTQPSCGPGNGNGNHVPITLLPGVKALDLRAGRFLNLHQCDYYYGRNTDHFAGFVTPSGDGRYATGTNVSNSPDTAVTCGLGNGNHVPHQPLSGVEALDLSAGRYLNLHQCVYYSEADTSHLTTVVPTSDSRFATGTKVSDSAGTRPACGPGDGDHVLVPLLSSVRSFPLA